MSQRMQADFKDRKGKETDALLKAQKNTVLPIDFRLLTSRTVR